LEYPSNLDLTSILENILQTSVKFYWNILQTFRDPPSKPLQVAMRCDAMSFQWLPTMRCDATLRAMRGDADMKRWALYGDAVRRRWGTKVMRCAIYGDTDFHLSGHDIACRYNCGSCGSAERA